MSQVLNHLWTLLLVNGLTVLLSMPFLAGLAFLMRSLQLSSGTALVLVCAGLLVLPTPTLAGLHTVMWQLAQGEPIQLGDWWDGFKASGLLALRVWCLGVVSLAVIIANLIYYPTMHFGFAPILEVMWAYILALWLCIHISVYPLVVAQEVQSVTLVYRNAIVLATSNRVTTLCATVVWSGLILLMSLSMVVAFLGVALVAGVQQNFAAGLVASHTRRGPTGAEAL